MGADLYIESRFTNNHERWSKRFDRAVERCYDRMYSNGYFRDSYNNSNLLWQFGLSWWRDVIPMLNRKGELSPRRAQKLLSMLDSRSAEFEERIAAQPATEQKYFRKKWRALRYFLTTAIEQGEPIACSL